MEKSLIDNVALVCGDIPLAVLDCAYARWEYILTTEWGSKPDRDIFYRGITVPSRFLTELAENCFRSGLSHQLGEIIGGDWGLSLTEALISTTGKGKKTQTADEAKMVEHGKGTGFTYTNDGSGQHYYSESRGIDPHRKFRHVFRDLRGEVESIRGIASALLWGAQSNWCVGFPTSVVKVHSPKGAISLDKKPTLFSAFFPLEGKTHYFWVELTKKQLEAFQEVCSVNRGESPDEWQGMAWRSAYTYRVSEQYWGMRKTRKVVVGNRNTFGSSIVNGKLRDNMVFSAFMNATRGFIQHEYGNVPKGTAIVQIDDWQSTDLYAGYKPYTESEFIENSPELVMELITRKGVNLTRTELKILRALSSTVTGLDLDPEKYSRGRYDGKGRLGHAKKTGRAEVYDIINATRGEGEDYMGQSTFTYGWNSLVAKTRELIREAVREGEADTAKPTALLTEE